MNETHASSLKAEPLSALKAVAAGIDFTDLQVGAHGLFWNEYRPEDGACRIWHWRDNAAHCLTPAGFSVSSRVYEYGGRSFCLSDDGLVFVNEADQQLYRQALTGAPQALTSGDCRYGDLQWANGQVLAVEEHGDQHRLVAIDLNDGQRHLQVQGADFYAAPTLSPDATRLAWIEWSRPHQPWTATRLMVAERDDRSGFAAPRCVAGDDLEESLQQPRFDANGRLYCLTDRGGFWQPWVESASGLQPLPSARADHAPAPWQLGGCTWLPLGDERYLASWTVDGFGRLGICAGAAVEDFTGHYSRFRGLAFDQQCIFAIAASPNAPSAVIAIDRRTHHVNVLAGGIALLPADQISQPQPLRYPSGTGEAHGFFYPALGNVSQPPLVVFIHGGPTSACYPMLDPRIQYWAQRGFAVADLNYRGSSGYGRAYRHALHLRWGEVDVEDACAVVAHLAGRGLIDGDCAFIRGGSAGGYTTLCALALRDVFCAGASLYGVSDPLALARTTHKFEGDYLDWLIGDPHVDAERYAARTPLRHASNIRVPVIFFQGELDAVVVPQQTRDMLKALQDNGIAAQAHYYPDERHGFRKASNQAHALEQEWLFYCGVMDRQGN
ncbi:Dipeptidyl aminopeptidase/acylaminoacyl peptidase [Pseudomonas sp. ok272]|uniref:S9 family peptidase n=1 Tax=unclassified Pseudomonas TaxID=196821 RepID=UPI0008B79EF3|nr:MULTISPECIES: S9 family peptidase [unclassified Pseudomonas]SEM78235.1 Dipeptidyl aminopeptidase/acylaminoacyl peptidase [Pseudomonas sp. ok272]SFM70171.1 Dipeptidyl aminopeptidase/acylaminoacyl peptidase [Pseudomonas sp. ok602]